LNDRIVNDTSINCLYESGLNRLGKSRRSR